LACIGSAAAAAAAAACLLTTAAAVAAAASAQHQHQAAASVCDEAFGCQLHGGRARALPNQLLLAVRRHRVTVTAVSRRMCHDVLNCRIGHVFQPLSTRVKQAPHAVAAV